MAEGLGFEPRKELPLCRFSRPVLSTAQPSFHKQAFISIIIKFNKKSYSKNLFFCYFICLYYDQIFKKN